MRIVLDTNVFVSGFLLPKSTPGRILGEWRRAAFTLVTSQPMIEELEEVLFRPRIRKRIRLSDEEIRYYVAYIRFTSEIVAPAQGILHQPRDADDSVVLGTFLAGKADFLITGDNDLLELADHYPILTPADFWRQTGG